MTRVVIEGNDFSTLSEFYDEVEKKMTKNLNWSIGRNLDAFNDVLYGGFGVFEDESIELIWNNSKRSKQVLGKDETIRYLYRLLDTAHPSNIPNIKEHINKLETGTGPLLYDIILEIIAEHKNINLILD